MNSCEGCKYWSEMIARACGGPVEAMCLHPEKPRVYTTYACGRREEGDPIDLPKREEEND